MARHPVAAAPRRGILPAAGEGGFTLVEILVVLAILATLIGLVAAMIPIALKQKAVTQTGSTISAVGIALETLESDRDQFGKYPPSRVKALRIRKGDVGRDLGQQNDVNTGIECVHFLLNNPEIRLDRDVNVDAAFIGNTDGDSFRTAKGTADDAEAREYLDAWGNPLVYFHNSDYKDPKGCDQVKLADSQTVTVKPRRMPAAAGGGFKRPTSFQLFSLGPNGVQDEDGDEAGDDVVFGE